MMVWCSDIPTQKHRPHRQAREHSAGHRRSRGDGFRAQAGRWGTGGRIDAQLTAKAAEQLFTVLVAQGGA
ncbi:hypothetical protein GS426_02820 [Rhodococcus hoagii]|nr:hypothetical protein [Prescottella equi]